MNWAAGVRLWNGIWCCKRSHRRTQQQLFVQTHDDLTKFAVLQIDEVGNENVRRWLLAGLKSSRFLRSNPIEQTFANFFRTRTTQRHKEPASESFD